MTSPTPTAVRQGNPPHGPRFTHEERSMLAMLAAGLTHAEIGRRTGQTRNATALRFMRIYERLGAVNGANAVALAIRDGLITIRPNPTRATPAPNRGAHQQ